MLATLAKMEAQAAARSVQAAAREAQMEARLEAVTDKLGDLSVVTSAVVQSVSIRRSTANAASAVAEAPEVPIDDLLLQNVDEEKVCTSVFHKPA